MACRNYIPGPNGDCQRCGEMRAGHAGFDTPRDDGAPDKPMGDYTVDDIHNAMRAGHAGMDNRIERLFLMIRAETTGETFDRVVRLQELVTEALRAGHAGTLPIRSNDEKSISPDLSGRPLENSVLVEGVEEKAIDLREYFKRLRFDPKHHIGLGDIRLTLGQQEEIISSIMRAWHAGFASEIETLFDRVLNGMRMDAPPGAVPALYRLREIAMRAGHAGSEPMPRTFEYLMNAMEHAAQQQSPSDHGYADKRREVFQYVEDLWNDYMRLLREKQDRLDSVPK